MINRFNLKASLIVAAIFVLPLAHAGTLPKADYSAAKIRIDADYKADRAACAALAGNTKDICVQQAKGKEKVARAELEYSYTAKASDQNKLAVAKAESAYAVAKEKCDDLAGNVKDVCVKEAKAAEAKMLADAKLGKQVGEAIVDSAQEKVDADYQVAIEKCDALAGDAKANCIAAAKAKFGKT